MDIDKRLRELRLAKAFSHGDIERWSGMLRCYASRVEGGHTLPNLNTLERWARAQGLELHQLFCPGEATPTMPKAPKGRSPRNG